MWPLSRLAAVVFVTACGRIGYDSLEAQTSRSRAGAGGAPSGGAFNADAGGFDSGLPDGNDAASSGGAAGQGGQGAGATDAGAGDAAGGAGGVSTGGTGGLGGSAGTDGGYTCTPGATELCDARDNNCDGQTDEGAVCPNKCSGYTWNGRGYMFCDNQDWWEHADPYCAQHGMHIARIDSQPENEFATGIASSTQRGMWIDGTDVVVADVWRYVDGTQFWNGGPARAGSAVSGAYTNWATPEPDNLRAGGGVGAQCLRMFPDGVWYDEGCNLFLPMLCEVP